MATPANIILQSIIAVTNNLLVPPPQYINYDCQNPTLADTNVIFIPVFAVPVFPTFGTLPVPLTQSNHCLIVQNTSASAINVTLSWQPSGSVTNQVIIGQNGVFIFFDSASVPGPSGGYSFASVSGSGAGGTVAVLLGA